MQFLILSYPNFVIVLINHIYNGGGPLRAGACVRSIYLCLFWSTQITKRFQYDLILFVWEAGCREWGVYGLFKSDSSLGRESALFSAVPHFIIDLLEVLSDIIKIVKEELS